MQVKTSKLSGNALDWAVAKCEGLLEPIHGEAKPRVIFYRDRWHSYMRLNPPPQTYYNDKYTPSTDPSQAWPIIERERINTEWSPLWDCWSSPDLRNAAFAFMGATSLIAAMRCFVASKLGDTIEVPDELTQV